MVRALAVRRPSNSQTIDEAAQALRDGRAVVLPTETGYGLAVRGDDVRALERLAAGRPDATVNLVASARAFESASGPLPLQARQLAQRFWPGPLTLVLDRGATGFRVPGLAFTREVVQRANVPIVFASARVRDDEARTAAQAVESLGDGVDLVLDAGPVALGHRATVALVPRDGGRFEVLREGFLDKATLVRSLARVILFVCTGNTCRSPMAEGIAKAKLAERLGVNVDELGGIGYSVRSAGTSALGGGSAAEQAIQVMHERGIDIHDHRSRPLTPELVDSAESIFVMSSSHAHTIEEWFPDASPKVRLLDPEGVPDPVGQSVERYRETADLLEQRIDEALDQVLGGES